MPYLTEARGYYIHIICDCNKKFNIVNKNSTKQSRNMLEVLTASEIPINNLILHHLYHYSLSKINCYFSSRVAIKIKA